MLFSRNRHLVNGSEGPGRFTHVPANRSRRIRAEITACGSGGALQNQPEDEITDPLVLWIRDAVEIELPVLAEDLQTSIC